MTSRITNHVFYYRIHPCTEAKTWTTETNSRILWYDLCRELELYWMPSAFSRREEHRCDPGCFIGRLLHTETQMAECVGSGLQPSQCLPIDHVFEDSHVHYLVVYRVSHYKRLALYRQVANKKDDWFNDLRQKFSCKNFDNSYLYARQHWDNMNQTSFATLYSSFIHKDVGEKKMMGEIVDEEYTSMVQRDIIDYRTLNAHTREGLRVKRSRDGTLWVTRVDVLLLNPNFVCQDHHHLFV